MTETSETKNEDVHSSLSRQFSFVREIKLIIVQFLFALTKAKTNWVQYPELEATFRSTPGVFHLLLHKPKDLSVLPFISTNCEG